MRQNDQAWRRMWSGTSRTKRAAAPAVKPGREPVTVVITRTVAPGHEQEYRDWMRRALAAAEAYANNLGGVVLAPGEGENPVYHLVHRFADRESLRAWEESEVQRALCREADAYSSAQRREATGLETWFEIPEAPGMPAPAKWKMSLVTMCAIYPLTLVLIPPADRLFADWPFAVSNFVICAALVWIMTYAAMPFVTQRLFRNWLYRDCEPGGRA